MFRFPKKISHAYLLTYFFARLFVCVLREDSKLRNGRSGARGLSPSVTSQFYFGIRSCPPVSVADLVCLTFCPAVRTTVTDAVEDIRSHVTDRGRGSVARTYRPVVLSHLTCRQSHFNPLPCLRHLSIYLLPEIRSLPLLSSSINGAFLTVVTTCMAPKIPSRCLFLVHHLFTSSHFQFHTKVLHFFRSA